MDSVSPSDSTRDKLREIYLKDLKTWNKTHRLVGSNDLDRLYAESRIAFESLPSGERYRNAVDVGAGSGILGFAGFLGAKLSRVVLVEPDPKKAAFLLQVKAQLFRLEPGFMANLIILHQTVQVVSRETLNSFFNGTEWIVIARAFSSEVGLREAVDASELKEKEVFSFSLSTEKKFMLKMIP
jgi:16S rRNA G527 N7-methylase RsmG